MCVHGKRREDWKEKNLFSGMVFQRVNNNGTGPSDESEGGKCKGRKQIDSILQFAQAQLLCKDMTSGRILVQSLSIPGPTVR